MGALPDHSGTDKTKIAGLEIDFKLETLTDSTSVIPKDAEVWMYASLMSNVADATDDFETVACQVKYN